MAALVVVLVDVVAEFEAGLFQAEKAAAVEQFGFEPASEDLGLGVVVAVAASTAANRIVRSATATFVFTSDGYEGLPIRFAQKVKSHSRPPRA